MGGWQKRQVVVDDRRISVRERGSVDRTLIFLHGLGAHQRSWDRVVKHLGDFRVVTFDLAGHGRSDPSDEYSDRLLADLDAVVSQVDISGGYVLVGHSIGADLALLHESGATACRGIVLVDGAFNVSPPETDWERFSIMEDRFLFRALISVSRVVGVAPSMTVTEIRSLTEDLESRRPQFGKHTCRHCASLSCTSLGNKQTRSLMES